MAEPEAGPEAGCGVNSQFPMCDATRDATASRDSTVPSFVKTIRSFNMQATQLEIPATFVKDHGHGFHATVVLQGPSGRSKSVHLGIRSRGQDRVYFRGAEWRAFVEENEFQVGHQLRFSLVSSSTFSVRLVNTGVNNSGNNSATSAAAPAVDELIRTTTTSSLHQRRLLWNNNDDSNDDVCGITTTATTTSVEEQRRRRGNNVVVPPSNYKSSRRDDVVYPTGTLRFKREVENLLENNLQCPHFVTIMRKSHLRDCGSSALGVPVKFLEKYGMYFSEVQFLQGPSGRTMEVRFSASTKCARFTTGWRAFHKENGIHVRDVLLFSLRAPARWLVQVVQRRSEGAGHGSTDSGSSECDLAC